MPTLLLYLLLIIAAPIGVRLVLGWIVLPIKVRNKHEVSIEPEYSETSADELTLEQRQVIGGYVQQFAAEGFEVIANVTTNKVQGISGVVVVLANVDRTEIAQLIFASVKLHRNVSVSIRSQLPDDHSIATGWSAKPTYFPRNPKTDAVSFGWVTDAAPLVEAHRRRLRQRLVSKSSQLIPWKESGIQWLIEQHRKSMDWFVKCGYFYRDDAAGKLRKTWKGTFLSVWKHREPIQKLRVNRRDRQSRRQWAELGMQSWVPPESKAVAEIAEAPEPIDSSGEHSAIVPYRTELAGGEITIEQLNGTTLVRIGKPSLGQYLALRWTTLVWLCILGYFSLRLALALFLLWRSPVFRKMFMPALAGSTVLITAAFLVFSIAAVLVSIIRGLVRTGGTSVVSVNAWGLHFENAPSRLGTGSIRRSQIQNLLVIRCETRLLNSLYQLEAVVHNNVFRQPLLVASKPSILNQAREAIAAELGISTPRPDASIGTKKIPAEAGLSS